MAKLKKQGVLTDEIRQRLSEFWFHGVEKICDRRIKAAVVYLFTKIVPWQFFTAPASSSTKYHPTWQVKPGGLIRHTTELCIVIERQLQQYPKLTDSKCNPLPEARDILLAAGILHDTFKNGLPWGEKTDYENHHRVAAEKWDAAAGKFGVPKSIRESIYEAIFWHAGRWTPEWQPDKLEKLSIYARILHSADMFSSDYNLDLMYTAKPIPKKRSGRRD